MCVHDYILAFVEVFSIQSHFSAQIYSKKHIFQINTKKYGNFAIYSSTVHTTDDVFLQ